MNPDKAFARLYRAVASDVLQSLREIYRVAESISWREWRRKISRPRSGEILLVPRPVSAHASPQANSQDISSRVPVVAPAGSVLRVRLDQALQSERAKARGPGDLPGFTVSGKKDGGKGYNTMWADVLNARAAKRVSRATDCRKRRMAPRPPGRCREPAPYCGSSSFGQGSFPRRRNSVAGFTRAGFTLKNSGRIKLKGERKDLL